MSSTIEHLGVTPGLSDMICGPCKWVGHICTWYCGRHDAYLRVNSNGQPVRCIDCRTSKDNKERND